MVKRMTAILCVLSICLLLISCGSLNGRGRFAWANDISQHLIQDWQTLIAEHKNDVYYIANTQLKKVSQSGGEPVTVLTEPEQMYSLYIDGEDLYYCAGNQIKKYHIPSGKKELVFKSEQQGESADITSFTFHNGELYAFDTPISVVKIDTKTGKASAFLSDVATIAFWEEDCYYTRHAEQDFTIYRKNLFTGKETPFLVQPTDSDQENRTWYDGVIVVDKELYYTTRFPCAVYRYVDGKNDIKIHTHTAQVNGYITLWSCGENRLLFGYFADGKNYVYMIKDDQPVSLLETEQFDGFVFADEKSLLYQAKSETLVTE